MLKRIDIGWIGEGYYTGGYTVDYFKVSEGPGAYQSAVDFSVSQGFPQMSYWLNNDGDSICKYGGRPVDDFLKEFPDKKEEIELKIQEFRRNKYGE